MKNLLSSKVGNTILGIALSIIFIMILRQLLGLGGYIGAGINGALGGALGFGIAAAIQSALTKGEKESEEEGNNEEKES